MQCSIGLTRDDDLALGQQTIQVLLDRREIRHLDQAMPETGPVIQQGRIGRMHHIVGFPGQLPPGGSQLRPVDEHPHAPVETIGRAALDHQSGILHQLRECLALEDVDVIRLAEVMRRSAVKLHFFTFRIGHGQEIERPRLSYSYQFAQYRSRISTCSSISSAMIRVA